MSDILFIFILSGVIILTFVILYLYMRDGIDSTNQHIANDRKHKKETASFHNKSTKKLLDLLSNGQEVNKIVEELANREEKQVIIELVKLLIGHPKASRATICEAIFFGSKRNHIELIKILIDSSRSVQDPVLRRGAIIALGFFTKNKTVSQALKELVKDESIEVRIEAYRSAYRCQDKSFQQLFIEGIMNESPEIRLASLMGLNKQAVYVDDLRGLYLQCLQDERLASEALIALKHYTGPDITKAVIVFLDKLASNPYWERTEEFYSDKETPPKQLRSLCIKVLRKQVETDKITDTILATSKWSNPPHHLMDHCLTALGQFQSEKALRAIISIAKKTDEYSIRSTCARVLRFHDSPIALDTLREMLDGGGEISRYAVAESITQLTVEGVVPTLIKMLLDPNKDVQNIAETGLKLRSLEEIQSHLEPLTNHISRDIRKRAQNILYEKLPFEEKKRRKWHVAS